jgi:hypothetical protein
MPYRIFNERLNKHWRDVQLLSIDGVAECDLVRETVVRPELFELKIDREHFNLFFQRNKIHIAGIEYIALQPGEV